MEQFPLLEAYIQLLLHTTLLVSLPWVCILPRQQETLSTQVNIRHQHPDFNFYLHHCHHRQTNCVYWVSPFCCVFFINKINNI